MAPQIDDFVGGIDKIGRKSFANDADRIKARNAASALLSRLESPYDTMWKVVWSNTYYGPVLKILRDLKLFQQWHAAGGGPKTSDELAQLVGADPNLMSRLLQHVAAMHGLDRTADGAYTMTPFTEGLGKPPSQEGMWLLFNVTGRGAWNLPAFLAETKYRDPSDQAHGNWQHMYGDGVSAFDTVNSSKESIESFQSMMAYCSMNQPKLGELFPLDGVFSNAKPGPILVDVGGGLGHNIADIQAAYPSLPEGSLILQDMPTVVDSAKLDPSIKKMGHDFFTEQPVEGAAIYYLHMILHDWPDDRATVILKSLVPALERGYSRILIQETVITERPGTRATAIDLVMMANFSAKERTVRMWDELAEGAGLKVVKIWSAPVEDDLESVIEMQLA